MCGSGQASFWRENVIAVVIRLRVQMLKFLSFCDRDNKKQKQKTTTTKNSIEPFRVVPQSVESKLGRTGESELAEMVTRARKSSEASESLGEAAPLSSFPLGQFALSSPAELRLDWLKRDCSQSTFRGVYFFWEDTKTFKTNLVLVVVPVLESKGLYCRSVMNYDGSWFTFCYRFLYKLPIALPD